MLGSPMLNCSAPIGAVVPKQLLLHPMRAAAAVRGSFGEEDIHPFSPGKVSGLAMGLLRCVPTVLHRLENLRVGLHSQHRG